MVVNAELAAAQAGDERAFSGLVAPFRGELHAHCYRMLGSVTDAEDAVQETLLRAWRGLARFEGRSSLRTWLHTIATNACFTLLERRPKRVLPIDHQPASAVHTPPGQPVVEDIWIEPYPDERYELSAGPAGPEARYEEREAVELAFVAALQHLPANQRAALLLRDVFGYSAKETAAMLETSVASANSALQRARASVEERVPAESQQATLRALGDDQVRALVERYVDAWERGDIEAFTAMLTEDASFTMPPLSTWYHTREVIRVWAGESPLNGLWRWRAVVTQANGQPALGFYNWDEEAGAWLPFALNVLTFRGAQVAEVCAFIVRSTEAPEPEAYTHFPDQPFDAERVTGAFGRFGLPAQLD